jgi:hypothetical protein
MPLRDFQTKAELDAWYETNKGLSLPQGNHCDDHALEARALAEKDGYFLSECLVKEGMVYFTQIFFKADGEPDTSVYHLGNMARVIEDQDGASGRYFFDLNWKIAPIRLTGVLPGGEYADTKLQSHIG